MARRWTGVALIGGFFIMAALAFRADVARMPLAQLPPAWPLLVAVAALSLLNYLLRGLRWRIYLARLGHPLPWGFALLTYVAGFAYTLSPGKVGEVVRAGYYRACHVRLGEVTAAFVVERLLDLLVVVLFALCALAGIGGREAWLVWLAAGLVLLVLLAIGRVDWPARLAALDAGAGRATGKPTLAAHLWRGERVRAALHSLARSADAARALLGARALLAGTALGVLSWGSEGLGLYLLGALAPAVPFGLADAVGIYAIAMIAGALSFLPGGLGGAEAVMAALLVQRGFALPDALLITLSCRVLTLWLAVLLGAAAVLWLRLVGVRGSAVQGA